MKARQRTVTKARTITEVEKTCGVCGKTFWGWAHQRYCGRACQNKAYYQRNRERLTAEKREAYHQHKAKATAEDTP